MIPGFKAIERPARFLAFCFSIFFLSQALYKNPVVLAQSQGEPVEEDEETLRNQGISGREGSLFGPDPSETQGVTGGASTLKFYKPGEKTPDDELNEMPSPAPAPRPANEKSKK
jgi:hypothetical protein